MKQSNCSRSRFSAGVVALARFGLAAASSACSVDDRAPDVANGLGGDTAAAADSGAGGGGVSTSGGEGGSQGGTPSQAGGAAGSGDAGSSGATGGLPTIATAQAKPTGIALTETDVYWANWGDGTNGQIVHCPKEGCGDNEPEVVISGLPRLRSIAISGSTLYWIDRGTPPEAISAQAYKCDLGACDAGAPLAFPFTAPFSQITADADRVYLASYQDLRSCPVAGCRTDNLLLLRSGRAVGVALGPSELFAAGFNSVSSCPLSGCPADDPIIADLPDLFAVALDADRTYWSQLPLGNPLADPTDPDAIGGVIKACPRSGCDPAAATVMASGPILPFGLAVDETSLYYTDYRNGLVVRAPKDTIAADCSSTHYLGCGDCGGISRCDGTCTVEAPENLGDSCGCGGVIECNGGCSCHRVQIEVVGIDGASGRVTGFNTSNIAFDCADSCSLDAPGNSMGLSAVPAPGHHFAGWKGACAANGLVPSCNLELTGEVDVNVSAEFSPANVIFWTSSSYTLAELAVLGSGSSTLNATAVLAGADAACAEVALSGGSVVPATGTYKAWIASNAQSAPQRLATAITPRGWVGVNGDPVIDEISSELLNSFYPVFHNEQGTRGDAPVLSGAGAACNNWTSAAVATTLGSADSGSAYWMRSERTDSCAGSFRLLCLQIDYQVAIAPPLPDPDFMKFAFLIEADASLFSGGLVGMDAACDSAGDSFWPATYRAFVATSAGSAASRFTAAGEFPFVRPDGVAVTNVDSDLFSATPNLLAPISVRLPGPVYTPGGIAFTGAVTPEAAVLQNCSDWTSGAPAMSVAGRASSTSATFFNQDTYFCPSTFGHLYCLQD